MLGSVRSPPRRPAAGQCRLKGPALTPLHEPELRKIRGNRISMVFQEPMTSLNPVFTVGNQIGEAIRLHQGVRGRELTERVIELLERVRMPDPARRIDD